MGAGLHDVMGSRGMSRAVSAPYSSVAGMGTSLHSLNQQGYNNGSRRRGLSREWSVESSLLP